MAASRKKRLYFWQPQVGVSVQVHSLTKDGKSGRGKVVEASSYCRAILNRELSSRMRTLLAKKKVELKPIWTGEVVPTLVGYENVRSLVLGEKDDFATLHINSSSLKRYVKSKYGWGWCSERAAISPTKVRDFYYLAELLCGTFGVLFDPRKEVREREIAGSLPAYKGERNLEYCVSGPEILFHPA
ncbi:MAG: hypothetical protein L0Y56_19145, partial [Nitrospira sp.]|nr:hypothetical protein [Nitrospira sp.]